MHGNYKQYGYIIDAFNNFRFGAFIEVTNGIHPNSAQYKVKQALAGEKFFKKICDKKIETKTGVVYIKNFKNFENDKVDFLLMLPHYDNEILKMVAHELLNEKTLDSNNKKIIETLLQMDEKNKASYKDLLNPNMATYEFIQRELKLYKEQYDSKIGAIKGFSLERYVAKLFKNEKIDRVLTRIQYPRIFNEKLSLKRKQDIDLLIICSNEGFNSALRNIKAKYNAKLVKNERK